MNASDDQNRQPLVNVESANDRGIQPSADATRSLRGDTDRLLAEQGASGLPRVIGRYQVKRWLGRGSFGTVYEGWDESLQRLVAIKVLTTDRVPHAQVQVRGWLHEARTLAALDHPGIVPVYDLGQDSAGRPFIVSKLIAGGSLAFRLTRGSFSYHEAARLVATVARALDYAHRHQVVHRDVKPANILLGDNGEPVLADFGLAIHESELGTGIQYVGTPAYMSPEQARREGHRVDGRTDIYSLGVVFYELLTRKRPFDAEGIEELLDYVRHVEVRPPRQIERGIPKELEWICLKALAKRANDRYSVAEDFADELCAWIASVSTPSGGTVVETETKSPAESTGVRNSQEISVIPHGLRPFNAADADFFLHLLPGPRDRHGLPESVRFWKTQIEKKDPGDTFRVGAVIGPSGSGKSSLVRAGIAPHLDSNIAVLLVEARPEELDVSLHKRLRQLLPEFDQTTSLTEALIQFRKGHASANSRRLLLVIDQFEQWLSQHGHEDSNFILESLRQCDGVALQALLLVRDDFTLALADFMDRLEEPLLQNHNFATVDFFSPEHAKKVLAAFGRAYGTVDDDPTRDQQRFLDLAIDELESNGRVVPVQLALFADMVKERPWVPSLLRDFGGARGVGVAFLDDRLNGVNAHPEFRTHRALVRRLLASLLPAEGVDVRPPACLRSELVTPLLELAQEATIERLLGLLDSELRLVTPSVSSDTGSAHSDSSVRDPAIQLTHDYLVPSIRQWLDVEERSTRRGRATIRLRELAQAWNAKPEPRRLPAWFEWLTIHGRTRRHDWNPAQRRMMRAADWRAATSLLLLTAVAVTLWIAGKNVAQRWQADALADQIVNADVAEIDGIVSRMEPGSSVVAKRLQQISAELVGPFANVSSRDETVQVNRRRLNIALVLARSEPTQGQDLVELLPTVDVDDLSGVRRAWPPHAPGLQEKLWLRLELTAAKRSETILPFAAILASDAPGDSRWPKYLPSIVRELAASRTVHIRDWIDHFQPLAKQLGPELVRQLRGTSWLSDVARSNLLEAIIAYCPSQPDVLASTVASARIEEFDSLITAIDTANPSLRAELRREFSDVKRTLSSQPPEEQLTDEVATLHEAAAAKGGFVDAKGAMTYGLSQSDFADFAQRMTSSGFAPSSIRPYGHPHQTQIATAWRRTHLASRVEWDLTSQTASEFDSSAATDGWWMEDFAWYPYHESEPGERRLVCLWVANSAGIETRCYFDRTGKDHDDIHSEWSDEGFTLHRYVERMDTSGVRLHSAIWRKTSDEKAESSAFHRFRRYFGDHEPGLRQTDLRLTDFALPIPDRSNIYYDWRSYEEGLAALKDQKQIDNNRLSAAKRLSAMGRFDEAKAILLEVLPRWERNSTFNENLALLYARMGQAEEFQLPFEIYRGSSYAKPHVARYLTLMAAVLAADVTAVKASLSELEAARESSANDREVYLRGLAFTASHPVLGDIAMGAMQTLRDALRTMLTSPSQDDSSEMLQEIDFDAVRDDPQINRLLFERGLSQLVTGAYREDTTMETRFLLSLPAAEHATAATALRQDGYLPATLEVHGQSSPGQMDLSSVWERQATPIASRINAARARAQLAMTLARLGEDDLYVEGMSGKWGNDMQSHLILESSTVVPATMLIDILRTAKHDDLQRGLILAAGGYDPSAMPASDLRYLQSRVGSWAASGRSAGVRQAACWCLTKWGQPIPAPGSEPTAPSADSRKEHLDWFTNSLGQTLVVLHPPDRFLVGSPHWDLDRKPGKDETRYWIKSGRTFAISATETTIELFKRFLNDPRVQPLYKEKPFTYPARATRGMNSPQISVSWLDAVRFCQWLSEKEGLPESEWCYPGVLDADGETVKVPDNFRDRRGYRLPTEAEWEFAARGGSQESRHCGYDPQLLAGFEWFKENSGNAAHPVAMLRPNSFGLFDVLGNVFEWSDGVTQRKHTLSFTDVRLDGLSLATIPPTGSLYVRGGRYTFSANSARSAERDLVRDYDYRSATSGFRIVQTLAHEF